MLRLFNETEKRSIASIKEEFRGYHYLVKIEKPFDTEGYLIAVSEEPETHDAMCQLKFKFDKNTPFLIGVFMQMQQPLEYCIALIHNNCIA